MTIFTHEQVSVVFQDTSNAGVPDPVVEHLNPASPDLVEQYHERIKGLNRGTVARTWIILRESFPYGSFDEDSHVWSISVDTWFRGFCDRLSPGLFPHKVHTGLDIIRTIFSHNEEIWRPGHGVFTVIGEKAFFLASGENGPFVRVSRKPFIGAANAQAIRHDWVQQTRMLYRSKTGYNLGKIHIVSNIPIRFPVLDGETPEVEFVPFGASHCGDICQLPVPLSSVVSLLGHPNCLSVHQLDILLKRKCHHDVVRGLKTGVATMLTGGLLLLAAACKGGTFEDPLRYQLDERWNAHVSEWQDANRIWNEKSTNVRNRRLSILLAGSIGANLPEQVHLTRIQVQKSSPGDIRLEMTLEGLLDDPGSPGAFQSWVDSLVESGILADVSNLQFDPQGTSLEFRLHAISRGVSAL